MAEQIRGVSYRQDDASLTPKPGYLPVLRAGNITDDALVFNDLVFVPAARISTNQLVRCNDVVIAASSGSLDVVGKAARALADFDGGFGAFCKVLRPSGRIHPGYFAHFFRTPSYRRRVSALAAGANINNLRNHDLDDLRLPLPPPSKQQQIAEVLDRADALRAKRRAARTAFDSLAQALFVDRFGAWNDLRSSAKVVHLGKLLRFVTSGGRGWADFYSPTGKRFIRSLDVQMNRISDEDAVYVEPPDNAEARRTKVERGDVLLTITGSRIGRVATSPEHLAGAYISQHVAILRPDPQAVLPQFLSFFLSLAGGGQRQIAKAQYGQTKPGLNFEQIRDFRIPLPSLVEQQRFVSQLERLETLQGQQERSLAKLDALFASLQHRAFRGEL